MGWTPKQLREAVEHAERQKTKEDDRGYEATESGLLVPEAPEVAVPEHVAAQRAKDARTIVPCVLRKRIPDYADERVQEAAQPIIDAIEGYQGHPSLLPLERDFILRGRVHVTTKVLERPWCGAPDEGHVFWRLSPEEFTELTAGGIHQFEVGHTIVAPREHRRVEWCGFCVDFSRVVLAA